MLQCWDGAVLVIVAYKLTNKPFTK